MMDELESRRAAEGALDALKRHLIEREEEADAGFEVEGQNGVLNVLFDDPPGKFVITPNTPVRQIRISALSTSFSDYQNQFTPRERGSCRTCCAWNRKSRRANLRSRLPPLSRLRACAPLQRCYGATACPCNTMASFDKRRTLIPCAK